MLPTSGQAPILLCRLSLVQLISPLFLKLFRPETSTTSGAVKETKVGEEDPTVVVVALAMAVDSIRMQMEKGALTLGTTKERDRTQIHPYATTVIGRVTSKEIAGS